MFAESLQRIFIIISPPPCAASGRCVLGYTITATSSNGSVLPDITVASDGQGIVTLSESGFDLCDNVYNFTAVANTLTGPGNMSEVASPEVGYFISKLAALMIMYVDIMTTRSSSIQSCTLFHSPTDHIIISLSVCTTTMYVYHAHILT